MSGTTVSGLTNTNLPAGFTDRLSYNADDAFPDLTAVLGPGTPLADRSLLPIGTSPVTVELRRKKRGDRVVKFKHEDDAELAELRSCLARFAIDNAEALRTAEPSIPLSFVD